MGLTKTPPKWEAKQLTLMAERVQETAERIARKMVYYKKLVVAPKYCQRATYVRHLQALQHTKDALNVTLEKAGKLSRQFAQAAEKAQCTEMN